MKPVIGGGKYWFVVIATKETFANMLI
jgi:hypothetical protein